MSITLLRRTVLPRATTLHHLNHRTSFSTTQTTTDPAVTTAFEILTHQRSKSRWSTLKTLFPHPTSLNPNQISQITLLLRNNPRLALSFFDFSCRRYYGNPPDLHSYSIIIHVAARNRLFPQTLTLIKSAIRVSAGRHFELFKMLAETHTLCGSAPSVFHLFVTCFLDYNDLDSALRVVKKLNSGSFRNYVNVGTVNALIAAAAKQKGGFFAFDLFEEMFVGDEATLFPNVGTFNKLLLSFHRDGVVDMVEEVWIQMARFGCSGNRFSYCVLMECYCEGGDVEKARCVWDEMKLKGVEPDIVAYNIMIGGYCNTGKVDKGDELFTEMRVSGLEATCDTYLHLVNGYCLARDVRSVMRLYKDMRRKEYQLDSSSVDAVVSLLCDKSSVVEALRFFAGVMGDADFVAREASYERLIKGLCGVGKMEDALKLQAEMVGKGFRPNGYIYFAFIEGYMKQGKTDVAERLRKEFMEMQAN